MEGFVKWACVEGFDMRYLFIHISIEEKIKNLLFFVFLLSESQTLFISCLNIQIKFLE